MLNANCTETIVKQEPRSGNSTVREMAREREEKRQKWKLLQ